MSTVPGQDAKDKGNAAFKSGDFPAAIGHYTAAILADPRNPTYPLNRAAAYLKLGKHEDAERDCDMTIKLDPKNVKAWFRRGQARAGMDRLQGAKDDFKRTLQLDAANEAAKQELAKVEALLQYRSTNAGKKRTPIDVTAPPGPTSRLTSPARSTSGDGSTAKRRRVPIKIVDSASQASTSTSPPAPAKADVKVKPESKQAVVIDTGSNAEDLMKPVSTRTLTPTTSTSTPPAPAPSKTTSFKDLKQAREASKQHSASVPPPTPAPSASTPPPSTAPPRVAAGGGIFRSNGQHTIFGSNANGQTPSTPKPAPSANGQGPMTLFAFNRAWATLDTPQRKWNFLTDNVPASSLPAMFKTSLEAPLLVSMLEMFKFVLAEHDDDHTVKDSVKVYLLNLARVPRFSTIIMFMSNDEKKLVKEVWDGVSRTDDQVEVGVRKVWGVL